MEKETAVTFRLLDGNFPLPESTSALEDWYVAVRDTPLEALDKGNLARACRQSVVPEIFCPAACECWKPTH